MASIKRILALNSNTPRGQMTTAAAIEYDCPLDPTSIDSSCYTVEGRSITDISIQDSAAGQEGSFVVLQLDPTDPIALTRRMVGFGPDTKTEVTGAQIRLRQNKAIRACNDEEIKPVGDTALATDEEISPVVDDFAQYVYETKDGRELAYNLYTPKNLQSGEKLPLVVFLHDSSVCSDSVKAPLVQGLGAIVWAEEREQEKRRCFVLAPLYPEKTAFDDFTTTWHSDATAELIRHLCGALPIDSDRVYGTGQSMGTMMLCDLNIRYPNLFAACFLVAGQWEPSRMATLLNAKLWVLVSEKDEKAFPIMGDSMKRLEAQGVKVARGHLDAKAGSEEKDAFAKSVTEQNAPIQFTWYDGDSVVPPGLPPFPGCFHLCTWLWAYTIEPIRQWLFEQKR